MAKQVLEVTVRPQTAVQIEREQGTPVPVSILCVRRLEIDFDRRTVKGELQRCGETDAGERLFASDAEFSVEGADFDTLFALEPTANEHWKLGSLLNALLSGGHLRVKEQWT